MSAHRPSARAAHAHANSGPRLEHGGLRVGSRVIPLLSGAVHYFRLKPERWRRALESVRGLGLDMVETYVPWGEHEVSEGRFDFGEHVRQRDLGAFLDLAHELGLYVFLRPGPNVNAELPCFGLPRRIVLDPRNQARSARGHVLPVPAPPRMFPAPSYSSANYRGEVGRWFRAVAGVAEQRRWPKGPIVLLQVDNEVAFYFRDAPYDCDYHPDALAGFARFLARRHGSIAALNHSYGTDYGDFAAVPAPKTPPPVDGDRAALSPRLDWVAFHEELVCESIGTMAGQLAAAGLDGLPMVHNLPMGEGGLPTQISTLARTLDLVGLDYYHGRGSLKNARRRTLRLSGSSRLAFAPELGVGAPPWFGARSELDSLYGAMCACAYGLRGFNLYMAVERDRWYGAPIDADGEPRASADAWRRFVSALKEVGFHGLQRKVEVALSIPKEYAQLSRATHALGAISPSLLELLSLPSSAACRFDRFGFAQPIQLSWEPLLARLDDALRCEQIPFVYVESDADLEAIDGLRLVFAPSFELAEPERWQSLQRFGARGGTVVWGPHLPSLNARLQPHAFEPLAGRGPTQVQDQAAADSLVRSLANDLGLRRGIRVTPQPLEATVHEDDDGPRVVFLINPAAIDLRAELHLDAPMRLRDTHSDEGFDAAVALAVPMRAQSCRMLIVEAQRHAQ
jgi:beta-galactosidase